MKPKFIQINMLGNLVLTYHDIHSSRRLVRMRAVVPLFHIPGQHELQNTCDASISVYQRKCTFMFTCSNLQTAIN